MTASSIFSSVKLKIWWQAVRPRSLIATYVPVALGGVLAWQDGQFNLIHFSLALIGVLLLQIGANLTNEYYDFRKGSDSQKTHGLGMVLSRGVLSPYEVIVAGFLVIAVAAFIGLYFVATVGWVVLYIGVAAVAVVILYTAGPFPLAYNGLGEIAVFIFMGPLIVLGTYHVLTETLSWTPIWASLPIAFWVANLLHANNVRDLQADQVMKKRTLAVLFGRRFARFEYGFLACGSFLSVFVLTLVGIAPWTTLVVVVLAWEAFQMIQTVFSTEDPTQLHHVLLRTGRMLKWFGTVYVVAWAVFVLGQSF